MSKTLSPTYLKRKLIQNEILKETYLVESDALGPYSLPSPIETWSVRIVPCPSSPPSPVFPFSMVFTISYNAMYLLFKFPHELQEQTFDLPCVLLVAAVLLLNAVALHASLSCSNSHYTGCFSLCSCGPWILVASATLVIIFILILSTLLFNLLFLFMFKCLISLVLVCSHRFTRYVCVACAYKLNRVCFYIYLYFKEKYCVLIFLLLNGFCVFLEGIYFWIPLVCSV